MNDKIIESKYGNEESIVIPRFVWEDHNASQERTVKRLIAALVLTILLIVGTNIAWLLVFNSYDITSEEYTIEGSDNGNANYMGANASGVINNGQGTSEKENDD